MSGHNKWSKIKHKKASTDAQKSKVFGKMSQLIANESKKCAGDRNSPGLKSAIEQAKAVNMPAQNIDKAVEKGTGADASSLEAITYELYGPGGCGILIDVLTDNRNRTAAEIKHLVSKNGYTLSTPGSASWMFAKSNVETVPQTTIEISEEDNARLETLVTEIMDNENVQEIHTNEKQ